MNSRLKIKNPVRAPISKMGYLNRVSLSDLLHSKSFNLSVLSSEVKDTLLENFDKIGGLHLGDSPITIGTHSRSGEDILLSTGAFPGLLGPYSFGFLNNVQGIAPLTLSIKTRPKIGPVAFVTSRAEDFPHLVNLSSQYDLGISWVISVGDKDPSEVLDFLNRDSHTYGIILAVGSHMDVRPLLTAKNPATFNKPLTIWVPQQIKKTVELSYLQGWAQKTRCPIVNTVDECLAYAAAYSVGITLPLGSKKTIFLLTSGPGSEWARHEAKNVGLKNLEHFKVTSELVKRASFLKNDHQFPVVFSSTPVPSLNNTLIIDPQNQGQAKEILKHIIAKPLNHSWDKPIAVKIDNQRLENFYAQLPTVLYQDGKAQLIENLNDYQTKVLFKSYGITVTKQGYASSPSAALRIAQKIGFPITLHYNDEVQGITCYTSTDCRRQASLLFSRTDNILVKQYVPQGHELQGTLKTNRHLGALLQLGTAVGLLPLNQGEVDFFTSKLMHAYPQLNRTHLYNCIAQLAVCLTNHTFLELAFTLRGDENNVCIIWAHGKLLRPNTA